jgi:hypothetical protein
MDRICRFPQSAIQFVKHSGGYATVGVDKPEKRPSGGCSPAIHLLSAPGFSLNPTDSAAQADRRMGQELLWRRIDAY